MPTLASTSSMFGAGLQGKTADFRVWAPNAKQLSLLLVGSKSVLPMQRGSDGTFELRFVRPAEQWVQVAPFWLNGRDAPADSSRTLTLKEGQVVENVTLVAAEQPPR